MPPSVRPDQTPTTVRVADTRTLRVADVAVWYGARSGGIRTYLDAKVQVAEQTGDFEHHLVVPAEHEHHRHGRHELPGVSVSRANGYRLPIDVRPLLRTLRQVRPDIVLLHDPHWWPATVLGAARQLGSTVVAVHHGTAAATAIGKPGPNGLWRYGLSAWQRRLYQRVDGVMAVGGLPPEAADQAHIPLRYGVHPAFSPHALPHRQDHVLYAGRLSPEKGVELLLDAMAYAPSPWTLHLVGHGPSERALRRRAARLGLSHRVVFRPFIQEPHALARAYAHAACVVVPGSHETFGLVALEAAASGASVVASSTVPSAQQAAGLVHHFPAGDARGLAASIARAIATDPDRRAAAELGARLSWQAAIVAELADLGALLR